MTKRRKRKMTISFSSLKPRKLTLRNRQLLDSTRRRKMSLKKRKNQKRNYLKKEQLASH